MKVGCLEKKAGLEFILLKLLAVKEKTLKHVAHDIDCLASHLPEGVDCDQIVGHDPN